MISWLIFWSIYLVIHIVCGVLAYFIVRWWICRDGYRWTKHDRAQGLKPSFSGPIFLIAVLLAIIIIKLNNDDSPEEK